MIRTVPVALGDRSYDVRIGPGLIAREAAAVGARVVHVSAIGADLDSEANYARSKALGEAEVLAHARAELAGFKVPVRVVFVDDLPRSTIEKLARSRLRERAARLVEGTAHEHS